MNLFDLSNFNLFLLVCLIPIGLGIHDYMKLRKQVRTDDETQYEEFYALIEFYIDKWPDNESLRLPMIHMCDMLEDMPHKNIEKSEVLRGRVDFKFRDKSLDEINELKKQHNELVFMAEGLDYEHQWSLQQDLFAKANNIKTQINELEKQVI